MRWLGVRKKYWLDIPIGGLLEAITTVLLSRVIPEPYAFGCGVFLLGVTLYPLNREFGRAEGRDLRYARVLVGSLVGALVAAVLYPALL